MTEAISEPWRASPRYSHYVVAVLTLGYVTNSLDRAILAILLPPIQKEFSLNYTELGLLGGLAFAVFYATLGIPIASLADRTSRKWVLAASITTWSAMTALCGAAINFPMLLATRIGTAIGEAGGSPPSHSLIADYFPLRTRGTALSVYALGVPFGAMGGLLLGGWGNDLWGWRLAFAIAGVPGLVVALLIALTVREPVRGMADGVPIRKPARSSSFATAIALWRRPAFRNMALAAALHSFVWYSANNFNSVFLVRVHGLSTSSAGTMLSALTLTSVAGTFIGGILSDQLAARHGDARWYMLVPGTAAVIGVPFQLFGYFAQSLPLTLTGFGLTTFFASFFFGPSFAMAQALAAPSKRAVSASVLLFIQTMIGLGLGPLLTGMISDLLTPSLGVQALRYALMTVALVNFLSGFHYWLAARTVRRDIAAAKLEV